MSETLLVIDEGTTSTRAMLFARDGRCLGSESAPLTQSYPQPGRVEHDAAEIWEKSARCAQAMIVSNSASGGVSRMSRPSSIARRRASSFPATAPKA